MNQPKTMNPRYRWSYQSVYDLTRLGQFKERAPKIEMTDTSGAISHSSITQRIRLVLLIPKQKENQCLMSHH